MTAQRILEISKPCQQTTMMELHAVLPTLGTFFVLMKIHYFSKIRENEYLVGISQCDCEFVFFSAKKNLRESKVGDTDLTDNLFLGNKTIWLV